MPKDNCEKRDSNDLKPAAKPKLIGWRTENFLWETDDIEKARNWEPYIGVLPIFEGDPHTKLYAAPVERQWVDLTKDDFQKIKNSLSRQHGWDGDGWDLALKEAVLAAFKEKNT